MFALSCRLADTCDIIRRTSKNPTKHGQTSASLVPQILAQSHHQSLSGRVGHVGRLKLALFEQLTFFSVAQEGLRCVSRVWLAHCSKRLESTTDVHGDGSSIMSILLSNCILFLDIFKLIVLFRENSNLLQQS